MTIPNAKPRAGEQTSMKDHSSEPRSEQGNHWTKASGLALSLVGRPCEEILRHAWKYARQTEAERDALHEALEWVLPLAKEYLKNAPTHPDNAKLETAR